MYEMKINEKFLSQTFQDKNVQISDKRIHCKVCVRACVRVCVCGWGGYVGGVPG
jgi:hypothetical protein